MTIKKSSLITLLLTLSLMFPLLASAAERIEGMMNGLMCAITGYVCPIDERDPMVALESDFVVQVNDEFYIIPNIDRAVKARFFLEQVAVIGDVDERYRSIQAERMLVQQPDQTWREVWSQERQEQIREKLFGPPR